jgi:hypothetical protein
VTREQRQAWDLFMAAGVRRGLDALQAAQEADAAMVMRTLRFGRGGRYGEKLARGVRRFRTDVAEASVRPS